MSADDTLQKTDGLDPRREACAFHTACGRPAGAAAELVGCSERTIRRWLAEPAVKARVAATRRELYSESSGRLIALLREAADKLEALLRSGDERTQLRAVQTVLKVASDRMVTDDFERRLTELEEQTSAKP